MRPYTLKGGGHAFMRGSGGLGAFIKPARRMTSEQEVPIMAAGRHVVKVQTHRGSSNLILTGYKTSRTGHQDRGGMGQPTDLSTTKAQRHACI